MLHSALERAVKERLILRNPTEDCIAPKVQKIEMQILPPEHIKDYLEAADRRGLLPMFYLELVTGLRKGEITALLWSDLDTLNKTISVSKQYVKNLNGELTLSRPKTETSVRKVSERVTASARSPMNWCWTTGRASPIPFPMSARFAGRLSGSAEKRCAENE